MGGKSQKMEVVEYYMSIHYGIASGPLDEIRAIICNEKEAWSGSATDVTAISIDREDLFGGNKKEGGVKGIATYLPGRTDQVMPSNLASRLGLTPATCPGYRGITSIFFTGSSSSKGFYWTANNPYISGTWIVGRRRPKVLNQANAMIDGNDANIIHVIYEAMTNTDWGIGTPTSAINTQSFLDAAATAFSEDFGISLLWTAQQSVEEFVSKLLGYIEGTIYVNPRDGLLTIKLIRKDYNPDTLFVINPDNAKLSNFQRKLWGETTNEIVVTWTNPKSEETETVSVQDLANIAIQGAVVSDSNDYEGIRKASLATKVAERDLRVASAPLASCEAIVNREAWDIVPGSVVKVTWPQHGMVEVIMRVGNVDYGRIGDSQVRVSLMEDVFSLDTSDYVEPPSSGWIDPSEQPAPLTWGMVFTLPYYFTLALGSKSTLNTLASPSVLTGVLGAQAGQDTSQFTLAYMGADTQGNAKVQYGTELSIVSRGTLTAELAFAVSNTVSFTALSQGEGAVDGCFAVMGTDDANMEICLVKNVIGNNCTLVRGLLDTVPKKWPAGTPIWFIPEESIIDDENVHTAGETLTYRPLPTTSRGRLRWANGVPLSGTMTERPWLPTRPANVKINGTAYGDINAEGLPSVTITWLNRNRLTEEQTLLDWDDASVTPESGATISVVVLDPVTRVEVNRISGLTGTSYVMSTGAVPGSSGIVKLVSTKGGKDSIQGHEFLVQVNSGYGYSYGYSYGS